MTRVTSISEWLLRQAFVWGGLACLAFYAIVVRSMPEGHFITRYFAGHPISYIATVLFFFGAAGLVIKWLATVLELGTVERIRLASPPNGSQDEQDVYGLLAEVDALPASLANTYLVRRLRNALEYVGQKNSADTIEDHLHYLEEADVARAFHGYAMVRIIMSTIPILGFLGTVIGITLAIGKMDLGGNGMEEALPGVISGLSVAFDTTALALSLSTVLLFLKFYVERVEFRLLAAVDESAARQLVGRFRQYGTQSDPHLASVRRIAEELLTAVESGMQQQAALLQSSFTKSSKQWSDVLASTASTLDEALSGAVADGLTRHALMLGEGVKQFAANLEGTLIRHAELLNESLEHHTGSLSKGLKEHGGVLARGLEDHRTALVEAEGQLARENRQHLAEVEAAVGEAMLVATNRQENLIRQSENLLKEMQVALVESAGTTIAQQEQLVKQGDVLLRIVESTDQVRQLEATLNGNLEALAQSHNFQQTVSGLSAALQLMSIHLTGHPQENTRGIFEQAGKQGQNQAA